MVTGASSGIGRAAAHAFARPGSFLLLTARRGEALEEVAGECRGKGATVTVVPADVTDLGAMKEIARRAVAEFGRLDVWVNNAAVVAYGRIEEMPVELWRRVLEVNLLGAYHGVRAALPWFREQGTGVLINVSSMLGRVPSPYQSAYAVSKQAMRTLSDCLREEVGDAEEIAICTVLPGVTNTPMLRNGANLIGRQPRPVGPATDARRVAAAIVRCADRPRREVIVGATRAERRHFGEAPAPRTEGNVFSPLATGARIDGWSQTAPSRRRGWMRAAAIAVAIAAAGATAAQAARDRGG